MSDSYIFLAVMPLLTRSRVWCSENCRAREQGGYDKGCKVNHGECEKILVERKNTAMHLFSSADGRLQCLRLVPEGGGEPAAVGTEATSFRILICEEYAFRD